MNHSDRVQRMTKIITWGLLLGKDRLNGRILINRFFYCLADILKENSFARLNLSLIQFCAAAAQSYALKLL